MDKFLEEIFKFLSEFELRELPWKEFCRVYRSPKRTHGKIVRSGYLLGCYESAIILYERARGHNIPVRFIEMIGKRSGEEDINSHCFVELNIDGKWVIIDPAQRKVLNNGYPSHFVFFSEGPYRWNSFNEFYEAQKLFIRQGYLGG